MSESEGFILKAEQFNQEEWCEMFIRVSETCKVLRIENEHLQNQLKQKENIIKEVREYIMSELITEWDIKNCGHVSGSDLPVDAITPILEILDKGSDKE